MGGDQKRKRSLCGDSDHRGGGLQSHWFCLVGALKHCGTVLISLLLSVHAVTLSYIKIPFRTLVTVREFVFCNTNNVTSCNSEQDGVSATEVVW